MLDERGRNLRRFFVLAYLVATTVSCGHPSEARLRELFSTHRATFDAMVAECQKIPAGVLPNSGQTTSRCKTLAAEIAETRGPFRSYPPARASHTAAFGFAVSSRWLHSSVLTFSYYAPSTRPRAVVTSLDSFIDSGERGEVCQELEGGWYLCYRHPTGS